MMKELVYQFNKNSLLPVRVEFLKNCPQATPTLVDWVYKEWSPYDKSLTKEKLVSSFHKRLNSDQIPFTLVALKDDSPVATISLKYEESPEFVSLTDGNPWLGSLHVEPEWREKGIGTALLELTKSMAVASGKKSIFLYTSNPKNVSWYCKKGAQVIETREFRNHTITIMEISLNPNG